MCGIANKVLSVCLSLSGTCTSYPPHVWSYLGQWITEPSFQAYSLNLFILYLPGPLQSMTYSCIQTLPTCRYYKIWILFYWFDSINCQMQAILPRRAGQVALNSHLNSRFWLTLSGPVSSLGMMTTRSESYEYPSLG